MDKIVSKIAALGLPGVILLVTMATTGLSGAAAITASLALLGPGGMLGGIAFLGVIGLISEGLTTYGLEALLINIYETRKLKGEDYFALCKEIDFLPISNELKLVVKEYIS